MAHTSKINGILSELVNSFATSSNISDAKNIKQSKDSAAKKIKAQQYVRTNQFDVESTLNGLIEKFSIVNRDDLADALTKRLNELKDKSKNKWTPELLSLFLNLSDRPDKKATVEDLNFLRPPSPSPSPITWDELEAEEPLTGDLWLDESYSSASEDEFEPSTKPISRSNSRFEAATITEDETTIKLTEKVSKDSITTVKAAQFWHQTDLRSSRPQRLSEREIIREVLFMLHGLPTSLFAIDKQHTLVYHATNVTLVQISLSSLNDILQSFASIGSDLLRLRVWSQKPQNLPLLQAFNSAVSARLNEFDRDVAGIEHRYTQATGPGVVSILDLNQHIEAASRFLTALSALTTAVPEHGGDFVCLELLYDQICSLQAMGDEHSFEMFARMFLECLHVYLRPVARWMEEGVILDTDESFFIAIADKGSAPMSLWHDRFTLRTSADGTLHAPKFLQPAANKILNAGKSIVFLQHLRKEIPAANQHQAFELTYEAICKNGTTSILLPFSESFLTAFSEWIASKHSPASGVLKQHLFDSCGLLRIIDLLEYTYFSKDGVVFQAFADELFQRMRNVRVPWDDKFLLSELARRTFGSLDQVNASSLSIRIAQNRRSSSGIKILTRVLLDLNLPWTIQNIIQRSSIAIYQSVFGMLLQVYRAKYLLRTATFTLRQTRSSHERIAVGVHQQLVWFTNIMHSYITETVIQELVETLRKQLIHADDLDKMCELHEKFIQRVQLSCLLASNLAPIYESVVSIFDLAIEYSELQDSLVSTANSEPKKSIKTKNKSQRGRRKRRTTHVVNDDSSDASSASDEDQAEDNDDFEEETSSLVNVEKPYNERLQNIHDEFMRLLRFINAGLRGVSRTGGELTWEMLAERLEWGL